MQNQYFREVESFASALDVLDTDPNCMFACLPIKENNAINDFTNAIRLRGSQSHVPLGQIDPSNLTMFCDQFPDLIKMQEAPEYRGIYEMVMRASRLLQTLSGRPIDFSIPANHGLVITGCVTQADADKKVDIRDHQDETIYTGNIYGAGLGVKYWLWANGGYHAISMKSPCMTVHRGKSHILGEDAAVRHTGQSNQRSPMAANMILSFRDRKLGLMQKMHV